MIDPEPPVVRLPIEPRKAQELGLVLAAAGIPHELQSRPEGFELVVASEDKGRVLEALDAYERENQVRAVAVGQSEYGRTYAGVVIALLLVGFHVVVTLTATALPWWQRGNGIAARILDGELWRTVTSLTLHAGAAHVLSNAAALVIFGTAVCRALGPGVGAWLLLLSGAAGNFLNAALRGAPHASAGASTASFAAVGILGALQLANRFRSERRRLWVPIAAALGLLAMLGTGPQTDVLAHLFGFLVGGALGLAAPRVLPQPPRGGTQWALAFTALGAVATAWAVALR